MECHSNQLRKYISRVRCLNFFFFPFYRSISVKNIFWNRIISRIYLPHSSFTLSFSNWKKFFGWGYLIIVLGPFYPLNLFWKSTVFWHLSWVIICKYEKQIYHDNENKHNILYIHLSKYLIVSVKCSQFNLN